VIIPFLFLLLLVRVPYFVKGLVYIMDLLCSFNMMNSSSDCAHHACFRIYGNLEEEEYDVYIGYVFFSLYMS
jgi:hypothetical protein